ncbi:carbohydrate ABC transporter permease [Evansella cellulosilytica]|uniref:Binding-protein-dependent transport systems inner membrane component n=1 Tax=Evansella cellulosilytica (strain ATCC 21833 / DSM 2522 / FERM P-1141 / JCM 9156 / N-4) TaxID=649639 RepID=E6U0G6_EVAC2|nr:carbohydrate ABC transporter permease [Evansella cellulosilytica]ADU31411.1 binding-protein-dependent transport systems inner membrane component [Evansella cellulosilytica DSM 2522]
MQPTVQKKSNTLKTFQSEKARKKKNLKRILIYGILIGFTVVNSYPILWMVMNSFKSRQEFALNPFGLPTEWIFTNYAEAWVTANINTYFFNSVFVGLVAVIIAIFTGALASFFLSRFDFKGKKLLYVFFVIGLLVPIHATLVPMFILMQNIGLINTRWALIFPYVAFNLPITIFLLTSFMSTFPKEIEESAIMDGCGVFRVFWSIILPMTRPAIATAVILNFINNWNEFAFALVLINDDQLRTLPLGLANFAGEYATNYVAQMSGLTIVLIPTILFYLVMEKQIVQGMTQGAVKG